MRIENAVIGRKVLDRIDAEPKSLNMETWGRQGECGTVACLAGHTMLAAGYSLSAGMYYAAGRYVMSEAKEAAGILGLTDAVTDGCHLFHQQDRDAALDAFRKAVEEAEGRQ